ncbi:hypothetical protein LENED_012008 [Lentinula edodes]|uniref:Uncharacterized protein n=1 Tax=Lentinula edodes TaxID=5353 RepID=A0A1Q3ERH6_LENED|nr:hypothetical protein LENED_012008 [Lentinula edodes]
MRRILKSSLSGRLHYCALMPRLPSSFSYSCRLLFSAYLLLSAVAAFLILNAVASPITTATPNENSRHRFTKGSMIIMLAWKKPGDDEYRRVLAGFSGSDRLSLFFTGKYFGGFEPQVAPYTDYDKANNNIRTRTWVPNVVDVHLPSWKHKTPDRSVLKKIPNGPTSGSFLIAQFGPNEAFQNYHFQVIRDPHTLVSQTNMLLLERMKEKNAEFRDDVLVPGEPMHIDPNLRHGVIVEDDLDWINTVLLYLSLLKQPQTGIPVLAGRELGGWVEIFNDMAKKRGIELDRYWEYAWGVHSTVAPAH